jgi:hypothetical protein
VPADRLDLLRVGEALADVVLGQELDPRHRGDHVVLETEAVGGAERGEFAVHRRRRGFLLQALGGVAQDVGAGHACRCHVLEEPEQLVLAVLQPLQASPALGLVASLERLEQVVDAAAPRVRRCREPLRLPVEFRAQHVLGDVALR